MNQLWPYQTWSNVEALNFLSASIPQLSVSVHLIYRTFWTSARNVTFQRFTKDKLRIANVETFWQTSCSCCDQDEAKSTPVRKDTPSRDSSEHILGFSHFQGTSISLTKCWMYSRSWTKSEQHQDSTERSGVRGGSPLSSCKLVVNSKKHAVCNSPCMHYANIPHTFGF